MKLSDYCNSSASDRFHGEALDPPIALHCSHCGDPIYDGQEYYDFDGTDICDACAWAYAFELFEQEANRRTAGEQ
jgi:hypothetical protein